MSLVKTVSRGQVFAPTAKEWNAIAEATNRFHAEIGSRGASLKDSLPPDIIRVKNGTADPLPRYSIVGITDALIQPHHSFNTFAGEVALTVGAPATEHIGGRFVVTQEPIAAGKIGRAMVHGITPVYVEITDEAHLFADVEDGNLVNLLSGETGSALLLYVQPVADREEAGFAWCYAALQVSIMQE